MKEWGLAPSAACTRAAKPGSRRGACPHSLTRRRSPKPRTSKPPAQPTGRSLAGRGRAVLEVSRSRAQRFGSDAQELSRRSHVSVRLFDRVARRVAFAGPDRHGRLAWLCGRDARSGLRQDHDRAAPGLDAELFSLRPARRLGHEQSGQAAAQSAAAAIAASFSFDRRTRPAARAPRRRPIRRACAIGRFWKRFIRRACGSANWSA